MDPRHPLARRRRVRRRPPYGTAAACAAARRPPGRAPCRCAPRRRAPLALRRPALRAPTPRRSPPEAAARSRRFRHDFVAARAVATDRRSADQHLRLRRKLRQRRPQIARAVYAALPVRRGAGRPSLAHVSRQQDGSWHRLPESSRPAVRLHSPSESERPTPDGRLRVRRG